MKRIIAFILTPLLVFLFIACIDEDNQLFNSEEIAEVEVNSRSNCDNGANDPNAWLVEGSAACVGDNCCFTIQSLYANENVTVDWTWELGYSIGPSQETKRTDGTSPYEASFCIYYQSDESQGISIHTQYGCSEESFPCNPDCDP